MIVTKIYIGNNEFVDDLLAVLATVTIWTV